VWKFPRFRYGQQPKLREMFLGKWFSGRFDFLNGNRMEKNPSADNRRNLQHIYCAIYLLLTAASSAPALDTAPGFWKTSRA
jgi:hypothetical protein